MPPIRKGDGTPLEIPGVQEVRSGDGRVFFDGDAIPDSVVSRSDDDDTLTDTTGNYGIEISTSQEWPDIQARLSQNFSGAGEAVIWDANDGSGDIIETVDISDKSALDVFVFEDVDLNSDANYTITVNEGDIDSYDSGFKEIGDFSFVSEDGNLEIVNGASGTPPDGSTFGHSILEVGNIE